MKFENSVVLQGRIARKVVVGPDTTVIALSVRKPGRRADIPDVYFNYGHCAAEIADLEKGDFVRITGTYKTRPIVWSRRGGRKESVFYRQTISGISIERAKSEEEIAGSVSENNRIYRNENKVVLRGRVSSTLSYPDRLSVALYIEDEKQRQNRVAFSIFSEKEEQEDAISFFKHDRPVFVIGEIQTMPANGKNRKKETIIAKNYYEIKSEENDYVND